MRLPALHATDFYKVGHHPMYPEGSEEVYTNFTCRSDRWATMLKDFDHKVVVPGLQGIIQWLLIDHWNATFFHQPEEVVVAEYQRRVERSINAAHDVEHIRRLHRLGYLPVRIKELPAGSRVGIRVPLFTIVNTHPDFFWVTNFLETQLSAEYWKMVTTATVAYEYRRLLKQYAEKTGVALEFTRWQGHDFSMRGMSGIHDATQCGAAHLMSFCGTDTVSAIDYLEAYYRARDEFVGGSVYATEHSVMCMGTQEGERATFLRLLTKVCPTGILSIVSDTWDFWYVVTQLVRELRETILQRDGKLVIRPDSGDPLHVLCGEAKHLRTPPTWQDIDALWAQGYRTFEFEGTYWAFDSVDGPRDRPVTQVWHVVAPTPAMKGAVRCLFEVFDGPKTATGYQALDPHIGLIYGDSITLERAERILRELEHMDFASDVVVFGIGSFTYQHVTRDTFGTAMKATSGVVEGERRALFKAPKTDSGVKFSARGLLRVEEQDGEYVLHEDQTPEQEATGALVTTFENGVLCGPVYSLQQVRDRLHNGAF